MAQAWNDRNERRDSQDRDRHAGTESHQFDERASERGGGQYGSSRDESRAGRGGEAWNSPHDDDQRGGSRSDAFRGNTFRDDDRSGGARGAMTTGSRDREVRGRDVDRDDYRASDFFGRSSDSRGGAPRHGGGGEHPGRTGGFFGSMERASPPPAGQRSRGVHHGKGPLGYMKSDTRIEEQICEALTEHDDLDASYINVQVKAGEVTLSGHVQQRYDKRLAEDIVESISGVKDVINQIRIQAAAPAAAQHGGMAAAGPEGQQGSTKAAGQTAAGSAAGTGSQPGAGGNGSRGAARSD